MQIDWVKEWDLGRWDVIRWARVFLGITLHPGQARMVNAYLKRTDSRWRAFYLWLMIAAGNRAGKTLGLSVIILHSCAYRMGLQPPDMSDARAIQRWGTIPYHWWHFAVEQGPAEQVFVEIATILGGIHAAQKAGCPWADRQGGADKIATITDTGIGVVGAKGPKERGEYAWIKFAPDLGGAEVHFRSTKAKAIGAVGQNVHGLSFDEAGLETNLTYLLEEVMHARRLGTGGQFILISTPSAATSTDFEDLWVTGDAEDPFHKPRRFSMRMSSRENVGFGLDQESFDALIDGMPEDWIKQNIDGEFIQAATVWFNSNSVDACFDAKLPEEEEPIEESIYLHSLDPGLKDKCWSMVFRVTAAGEIRGVSLDRIQGKQTTRGIVGLGERYHKKYALDGKASVETGVDTTALGGHIFKELLEEKIPEVRSVEFGGVLKIKRQMLSDLRSAMDEGRIKFPTGGYWGEMRTQHRNYKLLDRKIEQDLVMGMAIIVKLLRTSRAPGPQPSSAFEYGHEGEESDAGGWSETATGWKWVGAINAKTIRRYNAGPPRVDVAVKGS